jgi:hypothetical protein
MKIANHGLYDRVVDLHVNYRVCGHCQIPLVKRTGNPFVTAFEWFDYGALLEAFSIGAGLPKLSAAPRVYLRQEHVDAVDRLGLPADFCVIHRQSNDRGKDWTGEGWLAQCTMLKAQSGIAVVEVGAGSPERLPQPIDGLVNLVNRLSILETAEVIRRARLFIGVDSGPAHIANALEVPGVVLLGAYGFFRQYTPFTGFFTSKSPLVELVRNQLGPVADLSHDRVLDAVKYTLAAHSTYQGRVQHLYRHPLHLGRIRSSHKALRLLPRVHSTLVGTRSTILRSSPQRPIRSTIMSAKALRKAMRLRPTWRMKTSKNGP